MPNDAGSLEVGHQVAALEVLDGDDRRGLVDDRVDAPLAGAEPAGHRLALGDVVADADERLDLAIVADDGPALGEQHPLLAVGPQDAFLEDERLAGPMLLSISPRCAPGHPG